DAYIVHPLTLTLSETNTALIGANGSGKSTIARLINGLILPAEGSVALHTDDGVFTTSAHGKQVRRRVGFMFTDPRAQIVMPTVGEDIGLSLKQLYPSRNERGRVISETL